jgi:hypothetical protein
MVIRSKNHKEHLGCPANVCHNGGKNVGGTNVVTYKSWGFHGCDDDDDDDVGFYVVYNDRRQRFGEKYGLHL